MTTNPPNWPPPPEEPKVVQADLAAGAPQTDISAPSAVSPLSGVPRTAYLWLVILILSYLLPLVMTGGMSTVRQKAQATTGDSAPLTEENFSRYMQAESQSRVSFSIPAAARKYKQNLSVADRKPRTDAIRDFKKLAKSTNALNPARKVLILENQQGAEYDTPFVTGTLQKSLEKAGRTKAQIASELALWGDLYQRKRFAGDVQAAVAQIKEMRLRFVESQVLADLYNAAGQKTEAARYTARMDSKALASSLRLTSMYIVVGIALLAGVILLITYISAAASKQWQWVKRVATQRQIAGWGEMLDAFLFYLAFFRGGGFLFGLALAGILKKPSLSMEIGVEFGFYVGSGIIALLYLQNTLRRRGATLADVGFRSVGKYGVLAEIGYGIGGYCAILPVSIALKLLGERIFGENPNSIPNPVFPLITSAADDVVLRTLLYLLVAVGAPLFEEIFFRGALFSGFRTRLPWWVAAVLSAACFAVVHPMQDWLAIFGLGMGFAIMREMRQSLYPGMAAHLLQNSFAFFATSTIFSS